LETLPLSGYLEIGYGRHIQIDSSSLYSDPTASLMDYTPLMISQNIVSAA
jgi:hypothetical protein